MIFSIKGDFVYSKNKDELVEFKDSYLICENGISFGIVKDLPDKYKNEKIYDYTSHLIIPGLVDLHLHAPQYQFVGMHMDLELLDWLNTYTFPEEAKYKDLEYAKKTYDIFAKDLKNSATTRFSAFATLHREATNYLFSKLEETGLCGFVGKVNQDRNNLDILSETTEESIMETKKWLVDVMKYKNIKPIITPRFIPSCTNELLEGLSQIANENELPIQSHLSENRSEIDWVKSLVPESKSYGDAYHIFNMFGENTNTIMAHVVWPVDEDIKLLRQNKVWIAHSPSSNRNLTSGLAPIKMFLENDIKVGLATDVAGGSYLSMFRAIEDAITVSKMRFDHVDEKYKPLTFNNAFYLATLGGGAFFGKVGSFEKGFELDCLILDESEIPTTLFDELSPIERLVRFIYRPNNKLINKFVKGNEISLDR